MKVKYLEPRIEELKLNSKIKRSLYSLKEHLSTKMFESVLDEIENFENNKYIKINELMRNFKLAKKHVVFPFIKKTDYKEINKKVEQVLNKTQKLRKLFPELPIVEIIDCFNANQAKKLKIPIIKINKTSKNLEKNSSDFKFWRRKLRAIANQEIEKANHLLGLIGKNYKLTSKEVQQKYRIEEKIAEKAFGGDTQKKNQRRFEQNRCFVNGMIEYARKNQLLCSFITITVPAEYHLKKTSQNPQNHISPEEINRLIRKKWTNVTKKLSEEKIERLGCRVVEAHLDGTPHWHILMWYEEISKPRIIQLFNQKFSDFIGVRESNVFWENLTHNKYKEQRKMAMYLLKTIEPTKEKEQVRDYRKVWGIRSPEYFGISGITGIWRACRNSKSTIDFADPWMKELQRLAKGNYFSEFLAMIKENPTLKERFN